MLINYVYETTLQLASKSSGDGYLPPSEFNNYCILAQKRAINELYNYLDHNQKVITLLSDVTKIADLTVTNNYATRPTDYYKYVASAALAFNSDTGKFVQSEGEYIGKTELASRLTSKIVTPTNDYPIISEDQTGFRLDPDTISRIKLTYLINPVDPEWVAVDPDVIPPVFDPTASTDFILSEKFTDILVNYVANMFGIESDDQFLAQATVQQLVKAL